MLVINVWRQELEQRGSHLDENQRQRDYPREPVQSVGTVHNTVHRFVARYKVCYLPDLFSLEIPIQSMPLLRQRLLELFQLTTGLLNPLAYGRLLTLGVLKYGTSSANTSPPQFRTAD